VMGFKVFLDMQVAYARLMLPAELIRTTLGLPMDPSGPMFARRLDSLRGRMNRVAHARTFLTVEAGRSELTEDDLAGVEAGDILLVEKTGLKKDGESLTGEVEIRVGDGTHGIVRGNLVELEGGGQGVEITGIECFPEPDPAAADAESPPESSPEEAVDAFGEQEEQSMHSPLRPRGGPVARSGRGRGFGAGVPARGVGGDALSDDAQDGEHQTDDESEEQPQDEEQPQEEAGPSDNLSETEGLLKDVAMPVVVELGRIKTTAGDVVALRPGQILELRRAPNDPVDITVNGRLVAKGELVEVEGELGVRLLSLVR